MTRAASNSRVVSIQRTLATVTSIPQKRCTKCGELKPATTEYFHSDKQRSDGLYSSCKTCREKYRKTISQKQYYKEYHRDYMRARNRRNGVKPLPYRKIVNGRARCSKCKEWKSVAEFSTAKRNAIGLANWCRECHSQHTTLKRRLKGVKPLKRGQTENGLRECTRCKTWYPDTKQYFYTDKNGKSRTQCKQCISIDSKNNPQKAEYNQEYYKRNHSVILIQKQGYYLENKDKIREFQQDWYSRNPDYRRDYNRNYRVKYHPILIQKDKEYRKAHPQVGKAHQHRRRAKKKGLGGLIFDQVKLFTYWNDCCAICGRSCGFWNTVVLDHWIALADTRLDNPGHVPWNLVPMCHSLPGIPSGEPCCNNSKSSRDPIEWLVSRLGKRKARQKMVQIEAYFNWAITTFKGDP